MAWASGGWRAMTSSVTTASVRTVSPHKPHPSPDQSVKKTHPACERLPPNARDHRAGAAGSGPSTSCAYYRTNGCWPVAAMQAPIDALIIVSTRPIILRTIPAVAMPLPLPSRPLIPSIKPTTVIGNPINGMTQATIPIILRINEAIPLPNPGFRCSLFTFVSYWLNVALLPNAQRSGPAAGRAPDRPLQPSVRERVLGGESTSDAVVKCSRLDR